jgi:hypothetical protein
VESSRNSVFVSRSGLALECNSQPPTPNLSNTGFKEVDWVQDRGGWGLGVGTWIREFLGFSKKKKNGWNLPEIRLCFQ